MLRELQKISFVKPVEILSVNVVRNFYIVHGFVEHGNEGEAID